MRNQFWLLCTHRPVRMWRNCFSLVFSQIMGRRSYFMIGACDVLGFLVFRNNLRIFKQFSLIFKLIYPQHMLLMESLIHPPLIALLFIDPFVKAILLFLMLFVFYVYWCICRILSHEPDHVALGFLASAIFLTHKILMGSRFSSENFVDLMKFLFFSPTHQNYIYK